MDSIHPSLRSLLSEMNGAIEAQLYFLALTVALSLPDICSQLQNDATTEEELHKNRRKQTKNYKTWFNKWLKHRFNNLTDEDCFSMRCGVVHQGMFRRQDANYDRIIFITPQKNPDMGVIRFQGDVIIQISPSATFFGKSFGEKILHIEIIWFCDQIAAAVKDWAEEFKSDSIVQKNVENVVRYRHEGLPPYMIGVPLIA